MRMCLLPLCLQIRHPFLLRLEATFRDTEKLYMVTELIQGGELFSLLSRENRIKPRPAQFYAACVVAAMEHLHLGTLCCLTELNCGPCVSSRVGSFGNEERHSMPLVPVAKTLQPLHCLPCVWPQPAFCTVTSSQRTF